MYLVAHVEDNVIGQCFSIEDTDLFEKAAKEICANLGLDYYTQDVDLENCFVKLEDNGDIQIFKSEEL